jgi:GGDEF domain-containing protein
LNACMGSLVGDELLITVARRLKGALRSRDSIGLRSPKPCRLGRPVRLSVVISRRRLRSVWCCAVWSQGFGDLIEAVMATGQRHAVLVIDINRFGRLNACMGSAFGVVLRGLVDQHQDAGVGLVFGRAGQRGLEITCW